MALSAASLAVQSYCFRGFKENPKVAELVKKIGVSAIEVCGVHCNFNDPAGWDAVLNTYAKAGVNIVSIGVEGFKPDEAHCRSRFDFAKRAGCSVISANFAPDTFAQTVPVVAKLSEEYGIRLAIHNHGGYHWLGNGQMLDHVFNTTPACIGLCMDTAWAMDAKQDPLKWADKYAARLYSVHIKDFIFDRARNHTDVVVGTGNLKLPELFKLLSDKGFAGPLICEYEGDVNDPTPALAECIVAMRKSLT